jgi:hypothetical protein
MARCAGDADTPDEPTSRGICYSVMAAETGRALTLVPPATKPRPADLRCSAGPEKGTHRTALGDVTAWA